MNIPLGNFHKFVGNAFTLLKGLYQQAYPIILIFTINILQNVALADNDKKSIENGEANIKVMTITAGAEGGNITLNGVVEAVQDSAISAQVFGRIVAVMVQAGDSVRAGQILIKLEGEGAQQGFIAAQAQLELAQQELSRQSVLFEKKYISQAALDSARATFKAAKAQASAQKNQSGFYTITAPFAGKVSEVVAVKGELASPGGKLLQIYNPNSLRVSVPIAQEYLSHINDKTNLRVYLQNLQGNNQQLKHNSVQVLPSIDSASHTALMRIGLESGQIILPGAYVSVEVPVPTKASFAKNNNVWIPQNSLVQRGEMIAVYILHKSGRALLRQVRLGEKRGELVEVLTGLSVGETLLLEPQTVVK